MKTKDKIIVAAKAEFQQKGLAGARMQEIADRCGINKALLHYHFNSKDELFRAVLIAGIADVFPVLMGTLNATMPLREKLQSVIRLYIDQLSQNPELPRFVLNELAQNPNFIATHFQGLQARPTVFVAQIEAAVQAGEIRSTEPFQLIASLVGLCVFPFMGKPMIQFMSGKNEKEFKQFIEDRKAHVEMLLLDGLFLIKD